MKHRKFKQLLFILLFVCLYNINCTNQAGMIGSVESKYEGCFGGGESKITLYKKGDKVVAYLLSENDSLSYATLTQAQVNTFHQFIKELRSKKFGFGCTTTEYYTIRINHEIIHKTDGGCGWNGFDKLKKSLFGSTK